MKLIKVLVVDDMAINREILREMLESSPFITVVGTAFDGEDAIEKVIRLKPDLITLDLEMPRMDGFTFLRWLMKSIPVPTIVISSRADDRSVIRALEFGAVDFLPKPVGQGEALEELRGELIHKVKFFAQIEMHRVKNNVELLSEHATERKPAATPQPPRSMSGTVSAFDVVAIGSSTGGPPALQAILTKLPKDFPAAIVVSQHMPPNFTRFFAERLDKLSEVKVKEAADGDSILPGHVYITPGGYHLTLSRKSGGVRADVNRSKPEDKYVPSVDMMMKSVAAQFGSRVLGIILTGMGNDGRDGMSMIKGMGGTTLAESKETAVIYGMPKEAIEAGAVDRIVPLGSMASEIIRVCG